MNEITHDLKCEPLWFDLIWTGQKLFELRYNDRNYQPNHVLLLREWRSDYGPTGRIITARITCMIEGPWLVDGYVALGLMVLARQNQEGINAAAE